MRISYLFIFLSAFFSGVHAQEEAFNLEVIPTRGAIVNQSLQYLIDDANIDADSALSSDKWISLGGNLFNLGITGNAWWIRVKLKYPKSMNPIIELPNPHLKGISVFVESERVLQPINPQKPIDTHLSFIQGHSCGNWLIDLGELKYRSDNPVVLLIHIPAQNFSANTLLHIWKSADDRQINQYFTMIFLVVFFVVHFLYILLMSVVAGVINQRIMYLYVLYVVIGFGVIIGDMGIAPIISVYFYSLGHKAYFLFGDLYIISGVYFFRKFQFEYFENKIGYKYFFNTMMVIALVFGAAMFVVEKPEWIRILALWHYVIFCIVCVSIFGIILFNFFNQKLRASKLLLIGFSLHAASILLKSFQDVGFVHNDFVDSGLLKIGIHSLVIFTPISYLLATLIEMFCVFLISIINFKQIYTQNLRMLKILHETRFRNMEAMNKIAERERAGIAQELHDGLGVSLAGLKMQLSSLQDSGLSPEEINKKLTSSINDLDRSIVDLRTISHNIMPLSISKLGFSRAVEDLVERLKRQTSLKIYYHHNLQNIRLGSEQSLHLYRIVQELLSNIIRHAEATEVNIYAYTFQNRLSVNVEDNGKGRKMVESQEQSGLGLRGIEYRIQSLGGRLTIETSEGRGFSVMIEMPIVAG